MRSRFSVPLHWVIILFSLVCGCSSDNPTISQPPEEQPYVGAAVCGKCHEQIYTDYLTTGHSQQFQLVVNGRAPEYFWEDAIPFPIESPPNDIAWENVSLVLGGHFGFGVFFDKKGKLITGPQTLWNVQFGGWWTYDPEQSEPYDCASCHASGYDPNGTQEDFPSLKGSWEQGGVTCEGCHGPGRAHTKSKSPDDILVDTSEGFCLRCHGGNVGHPIPGFGDVDLGNSHRGSCSWCHSPHISFKYDFDRSIWRDCVDCHGPEKGIERRGKLNSSGICGYFGLNRPGFDGVSSD